MRRARKIGLLGGSFNPAHEGHLHISRLALARLGLDQVWWLVSPQNPLKDKSEIKPFDERIETATLLAASDAGDSRIVVSEAERMLGTRYTVDTLQALKATYPHDRFVWLMGADILLELPKWNRWMRLFKLVPLAVFPRPGYTQSALASLAAKRFAAYRVNLRRAARLADLRPPAWVFMRGFEHPESASRIRKLGK